MKKLIALILISLLFTGCIPERAAYTSITAIDSDATVGITGSTGDLVLQDDDGDLVILDEDHYRIHTGESFTTSNVTDMSNGQVINFLGLTGSKDVNLIWTIDHELEASVDFYEAPTVTANGTAITIFNRNRQSSTASTVKAFSNPTIAATGTLLLMHQEGSNQRAGGENRAANEWILKKNTYYLFRITNETALNNVVTIIFDWYEEN